MDMTNQEYEKHVNARARPSPVWKDMDWVPITGFANAMVSPALEFKSEGLVTGTGAKLFTVAGPVLVFGISASVIYGIILCILKA